jgi:glycosyltransferase involved in cell wall biosynthesis/2-polyprenyl-3-methyl-5-hydroxy-6-metoxy-1,4-benzoquinol methylase
MKAPISICLICKNEAPRLKACIDSIRPYVKEVIIVDTGSSDGSDKIAQELADIFEVFTDCNDPETGLIEDFSLARQRSFDLATQPWVMWVDADDIIEGADKLFEICVRGDLARGGKACCIAFPYDYAFDDKGNPIVQQYRERLVTPKEAFKWINPVHEVIDMKDPPSTIFDKSELIKFVHKRGDKQLEPNRNLRILKKLYDKQGEKDARQLYYLGLEYGNVGDHGNMINMLNRYLELSGWDDEKYMACLRLGQHYLSFSLYQNAVEMGFKAVSLKEHWAEGYLLIAKAYYLMATIGKDPIRNFERCANFARQGLSYPPTQTLLFVNPMDRNYEIHKFLNVALSSIGDVEGALDSCVKGLEANKDDEWLICNRDIYQKHLSRLKINKELAQMISSKGIDQSIYDSIMAIFDGNGSDGGPSIDGWKQYVKSPTYPLGINSSQLPIAKVTPHAQAWGIPSAYEFDDLPLTLSDDQLQACVLMIWKQYILHDEILSAEVFLEKAPYRVRHSAATEKALRMTKAFTRWMTNVTDTQKGNSPLHTEVESGMPLPNKLEGQEGGRFNLIADHLPKHPINMVDFGCFDGCFTNRYGMMGHFVTGLDLVETSVALANRKALEFNTGARHIVTYFQDAVNKVPLGTFDYVTSSDTYEHLRDTCADMLLPGKAMLKPDGKFLLVTPYGAWMRGNFIPWAHPWVYATEGKGHWLEGNARAHLIAPTQWTVAEDFKKAGFYVKDCYPVLCSPVRDVEGQGNVFCEAWMKSPECKERLDIVFYVGDGFESWTPKTVEETGIGGSELMAMMISKELAALGHRVRVYSGVGPHGEGIYDGVEYYSTNKYQDLTCDVLIVSRMANALDDSFNITAKVKVGWAHDVVMCNATNRLLLKADRIFALTEWHKQYLMQQHNLPSEQVLVTRNGVDVERFNNQMERKRHKIVNSSSPDRGWKLWFEIWDRILEEVPDAELHLFYGFENLIKVAAWNPEKAEELAYYRDRLDHFKDKGVHFHGRVNQEYLTKQFLSAEIWGHGSNFTETSCITAMEAQLAGLDIVTSSVAALNETVGDRGVLVAGDCNGKAYQDKFVKEIVDLLKNPSGEEKRVALQDQAKNLFGIKELAVEWQETFLKLKEEVSTHPIVPYTPTESFK